jgi:hypothetical protein
MCFSLLDLPSLGNAQTIAEIAQGAGILQGERGQSGNKKASAGAEAMNSSDRLTSLLQK